MPKRRKVEEDSTDDDSSPEVVGPGNEKRERRSTGSYMDNSFMREEKFMADMKDRKRFVTYSTLKVDDLEELYVSFYVAPFYRKNTSKM